MRKTYCVPAVLSSDGLFQRTIDKFWPLIENHFEEEWHVQQNGDLILVVDERMMERILFQNPALALEHFTAYEQHNEEDRKWEWVNLPEKLIGEYVIKGVYDANQRLVNGEREYFFLQG